MKKLLLMLAILLAPALNAAEAPLFLLTIKFKKSSFTLDVWQHAKNALQAVEVTLPVDKEFFDSVREGQELKDQFRGWSLLSNGQWSSFTVTVVKKETKAR